MRRVQEPNKANQGSLFDCFLTQEIKTPNHSNHPKPPAWPKDAKSRFVSFAGGFVWCLSSQGEEQDAEDLDGVAWK